MARSTYSAETKASVLAALLAGQSLAQVAAEYKLPEGTVKAWRARSGAGVSELQRCAEVATPKKREIGDLLLDYLRENLQTLQAQAVVFRDPAWLIKQNAADAAVLHGVMTDKTIRLMEALGAAGES